MPHTKNDNPDNTAGRGIFRTLSSFVGRNRDGDSRSDSSVDQQSESAGPSNDRTQERPDNGDGDSSGRSEARRLPSNNDQDTKSGRRRTGGRGRRRRGPDRNKSTSTTSDVHEVGGAEATSGSVQGDGNERGSREKRGRITSDRTSPRRRGRGRARRSERGAVISDRTNDRSTLSNQGSALDSYNGPERGKFGEIELSGPVAAALADMGYETPSPIQLEAVPGCLNGRDLVGQAITGSGKTAAFSIPLVERVDPYDRNVQAIVLVPTRELAMQVAREVERIGKYRGITVCAVYGGQPIQRQFAQLERGANVVVGTPGRIMDHMGRGTLDLQSVRVAVLDEADEMLDIGFAEDMEFILRHTPRSRQTLLFSATVPGFVKRLIRRYQDDPMWIQLGAEIQTVDEVDQIYFEVAERDKQDALRLVLEELTDEFRMLVFRRTQIGVDRLSGSLKRAGFGAMGLHGGLSQGERNRAMGAFRDGDLPILVSTNVAARGIDIPEITHVVNYDLPDNVEEYVHRIGRTARMGRRGYAVTFLAEWDFEAWEKIQTHIGEDRLIQGSLPFYD